MTHNTNGLYESMNEKQFDVIQNRMDKVEGKLDRITDALIQLARTEERILKLEEDRKSLHNQINRHGDQILDIQRHVNENSNFSALFQRVGWILLAALVTAFIASLFVAPGRMDLPTIDHDRNTSTVETRPN